MIIKHRKMMSTLGDKKKRLMPASHYQQERQEEMKRDELKRKTYATPNNKHLNPES